MSDQPGWSVIALGTACGFLVGVLVALAFGAVDSDGGERTVAGPARTVTVAATRTTGGTVIVTTRVPPVAGERLDVAKARLQRAGFDVDVDGGGLLGVLRDSNWEVVEQSPRPGTSLEQGSSVRVRIERR
jgi:hypothetical protein